MHINGLSPKFGYPQNYGENTQDQETQLISTLGGKIFTCIKPSLKLRLHRNFYCQMSDRMEKKTLRIKLIPSQGNISPLDKQIYTNFSKVSQSSQHFAELVNMFKMFMETTNSRLKAESKSNCDLEPRDRQIIVPRQKSDALTSKESSFYQWLTDLFKTVHSSAFNFFSKSQMSFEHAKIFCAENILKNLVNQIKQKKIGASQLHNFNKFLKNKTLKYLKCKYPITETNEVNKKFSEMVKQLNKSESPQNSYTEIFHIPYKYREDGHYHDLIMRTMNQIMKKVDSVVDGSPSNKTLYQQFQDCMNQIFDKAYDQDPSTKESINLSQSLRSSYLPQQLQLENRSSSAKIEQYLLSKRDQKSKQSYKSKVQQYTSSTIGRKIPENVPLYTQKQIASKNMTIKHPSVLRILVKWCTELWKQFDQPNYYSNRSESVKTQTGNLPTLNAAMRKSLDSRFANEKQAIEQYKAQLLNNSYVMQAKILEQELQMQDHQYVQQAEKVSGKFACKVVKNMQNVTIAYLNRLIHGILKISKQFYIEDQLYKDLVWDSPPNLLSFKVGDIMRCKCSSREKEILQIYQQIRRISDKQSSKLQIIRTKNRLKSGTNDILINVKFRKTLLCQIQLAINTKSSSFIKCSNTFNHYLYELERSELGPLTELCSIWVSLDSRIPIYESLIEQQQKAVATQSHSCDSAVKQPSFENYQNPFICSNCYQPYYHCNYLSDHKKCHRCEYFLCSKCNVENQNLPDLTKMLKCKQMSQKIALMAKKKLQKYDRLPKNGLCVLVQSKKPKIQKFMYLKDKQKHQEQIFGLNDNNQIYQIAQISTKKELKEFWRKHLVFQMKQEYALKLKKQDIQYYNLKIKVIKTYNQEQQVISLMDHRLTSDQCREIIDLGTFQQKSHTKCLFLIDNNLDCIPINPSQFKNLKWLTLSRNRIKSFQGLDKLPQLSKLTCKGLELNEIPPQVYKIKRLKQLILARNNITEVSDEIKNVTRLQILNLQQNNISTISQKIKQCKALNHLALSKNIIQTLPKAIFFLHNLNLLTLQYNKLKLIPQEIIHLQKLQKLYLSHNPDLAEIHHNITKLSKLRILHCGHTSLNHLDSSFSHLKQLSALTVNNTKIQNLPTYFAGIKSFQILDISGFKHIENCRRLTYLKELAIRQCKLKKLPQWLGELKDLERLDVSNNQITQVSTIILNDLPDLLFLKAKNNKITTHPDISSCTNLIRLDLESNQISKIQRIFLNGSLNLEHYILAGNQLTSLPYTFTLLDKLVDLQLSRNKLTTIIGYDYDKELNQSVEPVWPRLRKINLDSNQLKEIPIYLCKCHSIIEMSISNNLIEKVPLQLVLCKKLKVLKIEGNQLTEFPFVIRELESFEHLYLQKNKINQCPPWSAQFLQKQWSLQKENHSQYVSRLFQSIEKLYQRKVTLKQT